MIYPKYILPGDTIGVTATSAGNGDELHIRKLESGINILNEKGYSIVETPDVRKNEKGRSASKEIRAKEFLELIENKDVKAIITARGGEFLVEILPFIDFNKIKSFPKWIQGYSDTTGIIFCITTICDIATIYGYNFGEFGMRPWHKSIENNLKLLEGNKLEQESFEKFRNNWQEEITGLEPFILDDFVEWKNARGEDKIEIEGRIIGGCIDILSEIFGTKYDNVKNFCKKYKDDGIIWYFDNCELSSEEIGRTLWRFKENDWFKYCKGIVFGRTMTRKSNIDITFEEAIMDEIGELNIPIIFDSDIGHVAPQLTIINGAKAKVESKNGNGKISFTLE